MKDLLKRLEKCNDCSKFKSYCQALKFQPKACIEFGSYNYLKRGTVRNLFIAEAPPSKEPRYFYNTEIPNGALRRGLLKQLGIDDCHKKGLETFLEKNFLTDTIKCRLNKEELGQVPIEIITNCACRFLREEIEYIQPKNIVLLGDTARKGLGQLDGFEQLNNYRVKRDCGKVIQVDNYRVVLYAYPSTRNSNITKNHPLLELIA